MDNQEVNQQFENEKSEPEKDYSWAAKPPAREKGNKRKKFVPEYYADRHDFTPVIQELLYAKVDISKPISSSAISPVIVNNASSLEGVSTAFVIPRIIGDQSEFVMIEDIDKRSRYENEIKLKFPGGGIETAESVVMGAYREFIEEIDNRELLRHVVKSSALKLVGRIDLPSKTSGTHSIAVFTVDIPAFMKQYLQYGIEQCGLYTVTQQDIQGAIETNQMLSQHVMAWKMYIDSMIQ